jgi:competence protein ComEA
MPVIALSRWHLVLLAAALLGVLVVAGKRLAGAGTATQSPRPAAAITPVAPAAPARILVHVVGAVRRPGLYRVRDGDRVADAVARAGGAGRRADLTGINLAAPVADGSQVVVPSRVVAGAPVTAAAGGSGAQPATISLASATLEQLDTLPGIGPVTAQRIIDYRTEHGPFGSVEALDDVPGIGPATVESLRDLVTP